MGEKCTRTRLYINRKINDGVSREDPFAEADGCTEN